MKKKINLRHLGYDLEGSLNTAITKLQKLKKEYPDYEELELVHEDVSDPYDTNGSTYDLVLYGVREETTQEKKEREKKEKEDKERREEYQRRQYEELKKKFEK